MHDGDTTDATQSASSGTEGEATCPDCKGRGEVGGFVGLFHDPDSCGVVTEVCETCGGSGSVSPVEGGLDEEARVLAEFCAAEDITPEQVRFIQDLTRRSMVGAPVEGDALNQAVEAAWETIPGHHAPIIREEIADAVEAAAPYLTGPAYQKGYEQAIKDAEAALIKPGAQDVEKTNRDAMIRVTLAALSPDEKGAADVPAAGGEQ